MKSFEKEYRKMIQKEAPNLWDRIETELEDRERTFSGIIDERGKKEKGKGFGGKPLWKYGGIAAACFCAACLVQVYRLGAESQSMMSAAPAEEAAMEAAADMAGGQEERGIAESGEIIEEEIREEPDTSAKPAVNVADLEDGAVLEKLDIRIEEITQMKYHSLYRVAVVEDRNGVFQRGDELTIMAEGNQQENFREGEIYSISVVYDSRSEVMFHLAD